MAIWVLRIRIADPSGRERDAGRDEVLESFERAPHEYPCLLYTSDAADE